MDKDYSEKMRKQITQLGAQDDTWKIGYFKPTWYVLFKKESTDGRDSPVYEGRTTDKSVAQNFLDDNKNQYISARVDIYNDDVTYSRFPGERV